MGVCFWLGISSRLSIRTTLHASLALFGRVFTPCWSMSAGKIRLEYVSEQYILSLGSLSFYASSTFWCLVLNWHVFLFNSYLVLTLHNCTWYADVTFLFPEIYETKSPFFIFFSAWTNIYRSSKPCALSGLNPVALSGSTVCQDQCRRITALIRQHTSLSQLDFLSWGSHFSLVGNLSWKWFGFFSVGIVVVYGRSMSYYSVNM